MKILVTGGRGFIGSHLTYALEKLGHEVIAVDTVLPKIKHKNAIANEVSEFLSELSCAASLSSIYEKETPFDVIFHLAGISSMALAAEFPGPVINNNVRTTIDVLEYGRRNPDTKIFYISSGTVDFVDHSLSPYTLSKKMCEDMCSTYRCLYGLTISIVKVFNVYGPGEPNSHSYSTLIRACKNAVLNKAKIVINGDGNVKRDFVHVEDVVTGLLCVLDQSSIMEAYEIGSGCNDISVLDIVQTFSRYSGCEYEFSSEKPWECSTMQSSPYFWPPGFEPKYDVISHIEAWFNLGCPNT